MRKIIGRKPVLEALNSGEEIDRILISFGQKGGVIDTILCVAKRKKIKVSQRSPQKFKESEKGHWKEYH